jgi:hypothetical protein
MSSNDLDTLHDKYHDFRSFCKKVLPKVDPILVADLLHRLHKNLSPIYMVEVFTKPGLDEEKKDKRYNNRENRNDTLST